MLIVAVYALGAFMAVVISHTWFHPTTGGGEAFEEPSMQPWITTGWPTKDVEDWHARVCHAHWKLLQRSPYSTPKPLHDALSLDATSEPFYPQSFSSSPGKQWHDRVLTAILKATAEHTTADLDWMARHLPSRDASLTPTNNLGIKDDYMLTLMEIGSLLADDHVRGNYAQLFVPALTKNKPTDDEKLRQSRTKALEQLCA
ncbi:hypothetical protein CDV36_012716 [Fusarium kuroshium]|uniref:Uncharacterized protein n=1 Tax=Fusarium kuroshium TaxID=2010991 RepID=A0A3M2RR48_9HYPO|nr:hypothetical protein CDV36_012716 [Fusarium kuroshium]